MKSKLIKQVSINKLENKQPGINEKSHSIYEAFLCRLISVGRIPSNPINCLANVLIAMSIHTEKNNHNLQQMTVKKELSKR